MASDDGGGRRKMRLPLESPTKLTQFTPLSSEVRQPMGSFSFSRFFRRMKDTRDAMPKPPETTLPLDDAEIAKKEAEAAEQGQGSSAFPKEYWNTSTEPPMGTMTSASGPASTPDSPINRDRERDIVYTRSITNVLRRISSIRDKRGTTPQSYKDSDFKQYWMPDSNCKECYECGDRFTTFRRRHHCRVCGQIFCSRCCNQEIPGKIMGYTGDLRACTHCCRIVLSYIQSSDLGTDLRTLQEELHHKLSLLDPYADNSSYDLGSRTSLRRKNSVGFREEEFARIRSASSSDISNFPSSSDFSYIDQMSTERRILAQDSMQLRELWLQIQDPLNGVEFKTHRHRVRAYPHCVIGKEIVDWLVAKDKANTRPQATAIGQALLDAKLLESVTNPDHLFTDEYALYRPASSTHLESPILIDVSCENRHANQERQDPLWVKEIAQDEDETTENESDATKCADWSAELLDAELPTPNDLAAADSATSLRSSTSMFYLDLNVQESRVSISRPRSSEGSGASDRGDYLAVSPDVVGQDFLSSLDRGVQIIHEDISHTTISDDFLKGALLASKAQTSADDFTAPLGWHSVDQLRSDNGEKRTFEQLAVAYQNHEQALLRQLLSMEGLSPSWCDTIIPLVHRVSEVVRPDVKNDNDEMDIRQYVQFKKISGGSKADCDIVSGVVCTKNVAHKKMRNKITNPSILILSSPIVYQRQENKLLSLDPLVMQEFSYLKNVVSKIAAFKPDILLVEKTVSRLAQDFLLEQGITLVLNVKPSVIERVARSTQATIVSSVDAQITRPQLGMCHTFHIVEHISTNGKTKTLMYFEGCATHLGCSVTLRGGSSAELRKVKKIMQFMVYVCYNWRLERSFLMDEFALPPPASDEMYLAIDDGEESSDRHSSGRSSVRKNLTALFVESGAGAHNFVPQIEVDDVESGKIQSEQMENEKNSLQNVPSICLESGSVAGESISELTRSELDADSVDGSSRLGKLESQFVEDFSDPLHTFLNSEDEPVYRHHGSQLRVASLPFTNTFRKALDDTVLSSSPFMKYCVPYLESEPGRHCKLRRYFADEIYWSSQFFKDKPSNLRKSLQDANEEVAPTYATIPNVGFLSDEVMLLAWHAFTTHRFTRQIAADSKTRALLADFRARGGRIRRLCMHDVKEKEKAMKNIQNKEISETDSPQTANVSWERKTDALDPFYHQRLVVLFCSYSPDSTNAPNFCVNPRIINMGFYGCHDITLGGFLERYCFRQAYTCPNEKCDRPMTNHIRKFAHDSGCVHIVLRQMEEPIPMCHNTIVIWSWCRQCGQVTPPVPMSLDAWALSFAKYLELRFHGSPYGRRSVKDACGHSLHHDHYQYFGYKQRVVAFKYSPITLREIALPPLVITSDPPIPPLPIIDELKNLTAPSYGAYSSILEWLTTMQSDCVNTKYEAILNDMLVQHKIELDVLHKKVEEIQLKLTSPTLETKRTCDANCDFPTAGPKDMCVMMWRIGDCVVNLKRLVMESVAQWNSKLQDFHQQRKKDEKTLRQPTGVARLMSTTGSTSGSETVSAKIVDEANAASVPCNSAPQPAANGDLRGQWPAGPDEQPSLSHASSTGSFSTTGGLTAPSAAESLHSEESEVFHNDISDELDSSDFQSSHERVTIEFQDSDDPITSSGIGDASCEMSEETATTPTASTFPHSGSDPLLLETHPAFEAGSEFSPHSSPKDSGMLPSATECPSDLRKTESRGHERSRSEGDGRLVAEPRLKVLTSKPDEQVVSEVPRTEKKGVQKMFSQLLSTPSYVPIPVPFAATEHHLLPRCEKVPIVVYEEEIGSIIAYALSSSDYELELQELRVSLAASQRDSLNSSPAARRKNMKVNEKDPSVQVGNDLANSCDSFGQPRKTGMLAFFRGGERGGSRPAKSVQPPGTGFESVLYSAEGAEHDPLDWDEEERDFNLYNSQEAEKSRGGSKSAPDYHIMVQFSDAVAKFYCRVYFAEQFRKLRKLIFPHGEESYIRTLSRCVAWQAKGGKSGLTFCKTKDDRFILKQMSRLEFSSFLEFAPHYFQYISRSFAEQRPTAFAKIVGVYRIGYRNSHTNAASKMDLLVIENLFYGRNITQKFDLKGSVRNRLVNTTGKQDGELVLLDENLVKMTCDSPLYIRPHSKTVLTLAINSDTQFLAHRLVMDYSLLVGIDEDKQELVVGIIDYIRTFTWDKKIEMVVKSTGFLGGQGKMPTVVSPELYRKRFCEAMDRYFLHVPDRWSGLGQGVDC